MRSFISINLNDEIKDSIKKDIYKFKRMIYGVKWIKPSQLHFTLKFLGNIKKINEVKELLEEIKIDKFKINFGKNYKYFSSRGIVKVLYLPVKINDKLQTLNSIIE